MTVRARSDAVLRENREHPAEPAWVRCDMRAKAEVGDEAQERWWKSISQFTFTKGRGEIDLLGGTRGGIASCRKRLYLPDAEAVRGR